MSRLGITDQDVLNLPSRQNAISLPDGSIDWRFLVPTGDFWPTPEGWKYTGSTGVMAWLKENQTVVMVGAGMLLVLALLSGRRR